MPVHATAERTAERRSGSAARPATQRSRILELQRTAGNRAVASVLAKPVQRDDASDIYDDPPPEHVTGYLGLNPAANKEATALKAASRERVLVSLNNPEAEKKLKENPAVYDLVDELGISPIDDFDRWDKATDILLLADPNLREQLADLMRWFASAEKGDIVLDRLVLSGHSNGVELWGDSGATDASKPGTMMIDRELSSLATVFPTAAGQVEDVMFSACFSIAAVELVIKTFPNLRNCWSYSEYSPDIAGGSGGHIARFAAATEGEGTLEKKDKRGSSAMWTREKGFIVGDPAAAAVGPLYAEVLGTWRSLAEPMYDGLKDVPKASLDAYYPRIQALIAHPGASKGQKAAAEQARDVVLRLRFWALHVRGKFGQVHGAELQPAYDALGVTPPAWDSLTRVQLKAHIEEVGKAIEAHPDQAAAKDLMERLLMRGLNRLDSKIIKPDWI